MAKQLLKERFQELAGIKPLYENEASQTLIVTSESGARVEITDPEDIKAFLDAIQTEEFSELSNSLRRRIMFVSYFVQNEEVMST